MESQPQSPEFRINPENFHPWVNIWAVIYQHKVGMHIQQRFESVCTSAQSDQSFSFPSEEMLKPCVSI